MATDQVGAQFGQMRAIQANFARIARRLVQSPCLSVIIYVFVAVDEREMKTICPTRFVVDATENSK